MVTARFLPPFGRDLLFPLEGVVGLMLPPPVAFFLVLVELLESLSSVCCWRAEVGIRSFFMGGCELLYLLSSAFPSVEILKNS